MLIDLSEVDKAYPNCGNRNATRRSLIGVLQKQLTLRNRGPLMLPEHYHPTTQPSALVIIPGDLEGAGVRPTPLNIIARATDVGMSDAAISAIVDELAAQRGLDEVAA